MNIPVGIVLNLDQTNISPTNDSGEQEFYATPELLKHQDYYPWAEGMAAGPPSTWNENCQNCRRATKQIFITPGTRMMGDVASALGITVDPKQHPPAYKLWKENPVLEMNSCGAFWYCSGCNSIWTIVHNSFYSKVIIDGESEFAPERIKLLGGSAPMVEEVQPELGPKPSEDTTECFRCHVWRVVQPYSETQVQHVCPKCETVQLVKI